MGVGSFFGSLGKGLLKAVPVVGDVAGGMLEGRAGGRQAEADAAFKRDQLALQAARLNLDAPGMRLQNSARGDLAAGLQPVSFSGSGRDLRMSGGVSPSLLSPNTRQLGSQVSRDALLSQMNGPAFTPTPLPKANWFDKLLTGVGYAGLAGKGINAARGQRGQDSNRTPPFIGDQDFG